MRRSQFMQRAAASLMAVSLASRPLNVFADPGPWSQYHGDQRHAGVATVSGPREFTLAWYVAMGSDVDGSAVFGADGTSYVAAVDGSLRALSAEGGTKWTFDAGRGLYASPVLAPDGRLIIGDVGGRLRALNVADGTVAWTVSGYGAIRGTATVASDGQVYFGTDAAELVSVDATGKERYRKGAGAAVVGAPGIGRDGHVFWGSLDSELRRMRPDGEIMWQVRLDGPIRSAAAIGPDDTVYVGAGASILSIDPDNGRIRWRVAAGGDVYATPAIGADGTVYAGAENGSFYAVGSDGTVRWQTKAGGAIRSSAAVGADGVVYFGSGDAILYAFTATGQRLGTYRALEAIHGDAAIGPNGLVYFGSRDNRMYALKDSARRFEESPADRLGGALLRDASTGKVFVLVGGQRRHIPDATTQQIFGLAGVTSTNATANELALYPDGPALPVLSEGKPIRAANGPVYVIKSGRRHWVATMEEFAAGGYSWDAVQLLDDLLVRSITLTTTNGMLLRAGSDRVYLLEGGKRRWVTTAAAFASRGFTWAQVHFVSEAALLAFPEGDPLT